LTSTTSAAATPGLHARLRDLLGAAAARAARDVGFALPTPLEPPALERPRAIEHGDLASNLAFSLARVARRPPRAVAEALAVALRLLDQTAAEPLLDAVEVAGAGFLNLRLSAAGWQSAVADALAAGPSFGRSDAGAGERVLLEFVSANPTGPMHVGHGRGAVFGDVLARLLRAAGYDVTTEYYINNVGNQIAKMGESVWCWARDDARRAAALATWSAGDPVAFPGGFPLGFPEDGYRGAYIAEIAEELRQQGGAAGVPLGLDLASWQDDGAWAAREPDSRGGRGDDRAVSRASWRRMMARIEADLALLDIRFDGMFSERALHGLEPAAGTGRSIDAVRSCAERLQAIGWVAPGEGDDAGALLFRGSREEMPKAWRDGKDRVVIRSDGRPTYFAADIAYHDDKLARGYDHLINVLGADHHGYVSRLKGVLHALGELRRAEGDARAGRWSGDRLEVLLMQMVALLRDGQPVPMGKRSGEFVTLRDVVEEVSSAEPGSGRDAVRFLFLTRKGDAHLDFDLEVARRTSMDNPVYYVQYAHARLCSVLARAEAAGHAPAAGASLAPLASADERELALRIAAWPDLVERAARSREPHQIAFYAQDLARALHGWYSRGKAAEARVISDDGATTAARLLLCRAAQVTLAAALELLGVRAPQAMASLGEAEGSA
jgi:arginyl-tRNA synthetase